MSKYPRMGRKRISAAQIAARLDSKPGLYIRVGTWEDGEEIKSGADLIEKVPTTSDKADEPGFYHSHVVWLHRASLNKLLRERPEYQERLLPERKR